MKTTVFLILYCLSFSVLSEGASKVAASKEILLRGGEIEPSGIIAVCEKYREWCNGYYTAVIHEFNLRNIKICIPKNEVGRQVDEGIWSIIKSWLFRKDKNSKVTLISAIKSSLAEYTKCP